MSSRNGQDLQTEASAGFAFRPAGRNSSAPETILLAGVGNLLMSDDGVGVHAIAELQREPIPGVTMADIGTAILHGMSFAESASRVLVIDAANGGQPPGTVYFFEAGEAAPLSPTSSIHALGLREAMRFLSQRTPPPISIIGVEPQTIAYGMELSPPVRAALPGVVALARSTVAGWLRDHAATVPSNPTPEQVHPEFVGAPASGPASPCPSVCPVRAGPEAGTPRLEPAPAIA